MGAVFLAPLYLLMNLYLAVRILLWLRIVGGPPGSIWFAAVFLVLFLAAMVSPLPAAFARGRTKRVANQISNYWLGILMYLMIFLLLSDVVWGIFCLIAHRPLLSIFGTPAPTIHEVCLSLWTRSSVGWQKNSTFSIYLWGGAVVLSATAGFFIWGIVHAHHVRKVTYPVTIHKKCNLPTPAEHQQSGVSTSPVNYKEVQKMWARSTTDGQPDDAPTTPVLKIALVADLHLGYSVGLDRVQEVVRIINNIEPDLVIFAGDLFDNAFDAIQEPEACAAALASLKSTYGSYTCWGNHDVEERILAGFTFDSRTHKQRSGSGTDLTSVNRSFSCPDRRNSCCANSQGPSTGNPSDPGITRCTQSKTQDTSPMAEMLRDSNIRLLEDETILIADAFYLAGRLDASCEKKSSHIRKTPADLTAGLTDKSAIRPAPDDNSADSTVCGDQSPGSAVCSDNSMCFAACGAQINPDKPFLVIDHQPSQLKELAATGADLILSGHTHDGQMFPANLITRFGWMNSYGKLEIGTATSIVTSGAGTWGPPIRIGTCNEVVEIMVTFD